MSGTKFKPVLINGYLSKYLITDNGIVFRVKKDGTIKLLKQHKDADGYLTVGLHLDGKSYFRRVNRLVAYAFVENTAPSIKNEVNHINGIKTDNHYQNLEWVTTKENIHHAWKNNLAHAKTGESHPNSVYTEKMIRRVCSLLCENKLTMKEIANKTKVSYTVVKQIRNHVLWNEISKDYDFSNYNVSARGKWRHK